tara:strand:- start:1665 stop:1901 length:237 start_codon:yes stop_codon:yes gene_type:complete
MCPVNENRHAILDKDWDFCTPIIQIFEDSCAKQGGVSQDSIVLLIAAILVLTDLPEEMAAEAILSAHDLRPRLKAFLT